MPTAIEITWARFRGGGGEVAQCLYMALRIVLQIPQYEIEVKQQKGS